MSTYRSNWLTRTASIFIVIMLLIPAFFGGVRSVKALGFIYVDDSWTGTTPGDDPDGTGPATNFGLDAFATIQDGVTAVDTGGTVLVYAGTYTEQVLINKTITLTGENHTTTIIQAFPNMTLNCTSEVLQNRPVVCINSGSTPTIQGFTIDGLMLGDTNPRLIGIAVHEAGGVIQNNIIQNTRFLVSQSDPQGVGIYVYNTDTVPRTVNILNNTIRNFNKNGITVNTSQNSQNPSTFSIEGNVIEGTVGASGLYNSTVVQNGIQVYLPWGSGRIQNNTISKIAFNNNGKDPFVGVSILNTSTPTDTLNNVITGAQAGIVYLNDQYDMGMYREISGNQIEVFKPGTINNPGQNVYGVLVTDRPTDTLSPVDPSALTSMDAVLTGGLLSMAVKNNTISYVGTLSNTNTIGIEIDAGVGTSTVLGDNFVSVDVTGNHIGVPGDGFDIGLLFYQCDPANPPTGIIACGFGYVDTSSVVGNDISGNNYGVILEGPIELSKLENFHHNRIVGNVVGVRDDTGSLIGFPNNWWGCNSGPNELGCDTLVNGGYVGLANPWLKLTTTANPTTVPASGPSILTANLKFNSDAADTSVTGFVPNGIPVTFSAKTLGSVNPPSGVTSSGAAQTTFTAPAAQGAYEVCAVVDNQEVCSTVMVLPALITDFDLLQSVDEVAWTSVSGSYASGFTMFLDPLEDFYYLDADNFTANRTLADGLYPFFVITYPLGYFAYWDGRGVNAAADPASWQGIMWEIINRDLPIFYLKVGGSDTMLVDGLQYALSSGALQNPLRIDGTYLTGTYTFSGEVDDTDGYANPVTVDINFVHYPTLSSTDLAGPYTNGVQQEFHVTLDNADGADYASVLAHFRIANAVPGDVASLEYWEVNSSAWLPLPLAVDGTDLVGDYGPPVTGFPMPAGYNATSLFRVTFNTAKSYDVTVTLSDLSPDPDITLASMTKTAVVEAPVEFKIFLPIIFK